ncbi:MAG: T9SS type A sorting domain-containing protein, partial [Candidatus Zixiibacteriota bacterium]
GWEYFTYRHGVMGTCGDACPDGLLRIIALAETNDGANHPDCYGPPDTDPHELATMRFYVSNDRNLNGQYVPIYFFWNDCGDNAISSVDGDDLYVDHAIYDFQENLIWNEDDDDLYPEENRIPFVGTPDVCMNPDPEKPGLIRCIDFIYGGIDIIPSDSIDARGDVNLNGIAYEIADAITFTNYFIYGYSAFTVNLAGQIAATEINGDGFVLTVADLVYLIRVILGNAPPIPKLSPATYEAEVNMQVNHTATVISTNSPVNIGAAQYIIEHDGYTLGEPHLINGASDMTLKYSDKDGILRILVYSMEDGRSIDAGPENIVAIPINGQGSMRLVETQLSDNYGRLITAKTDDELLLPKNFILHQNYPNPFNAETQIIYELPKTADVRIDVLNTMGQLVAVLFDDKETAGVHRVSWNGLDINGNQVASGIFIYRLEADGNVLTRKMTLLK